MSPKKRENPRLVKYDIELPPPLELAKIAAAVGPRDNYKEALRNAGKLYLEACQFHQEFENATLKNRASMFVDWFAIDFDPHSIFRPQSEGLPSPKEFPAPLDEFLRLVVRAKTPADGVKRLRDYFGNEFQHLMAYMKLPEGSRDRASKCYHNCHDFLSHYKEGQDEMDFAVAQIERLKATGLDEDHWYALNDDYLAWWRQQKSTKARKSGNEPKKKS